jgi:YhcG PDDEXK nuclease domain
MHFYRSAIDDLLRHPNDQPSIGIILGKSKNAIVAEYALRDTKKPIGISGFRNKRASLASVRWGVSEGTVKVLSEPRL